MKPWNLIKRKKIVDTPWVQIYRDTVRTGSGVLIDGYYTVHQFSTAMALPITKEGNVVLICEYRHGCRDYVWQLPAGKIDNNETALEAAKRELLEETGYEAESWELLGSWYISSPRMPDEGFVFVAKGAYKVREPDLSEEITLKVVDWQEAMRMVLAGEIKESHSCVAILWMDKLDGSR